MAIYVKEVLNSPGETIEGLRLNFSNTFTNKMEYMKALFLKEGVGFLIKIEQWIIALIIDLLLHLQGALETKELLNIMAL